MSGLARTRYEVALEFRNGLVEHMDQFNEKQRETPSLTVDEYLGCAATFRNAKLALDELLVILKVSQ